MDTAQLREATTALALELPSGVYDDYAPRVLALLDAIDGAAKVLFCSACGQTAAACTDHKQHREIWAKALVLVVTRGETTDGE